jgi:hypothetical protein
VSLIDAVIVAGIVEGMTSTFLGLVQVAERSCVTEFSAPEKKEAAMAETDRRDHDDDDDTPVPWMQQLLDNPFLLLFLGVFVPMVVYTAWGVWDILTLPLAK